MSIGFAVFFTYLVQGFVTDELGVECSSEYPNCYSCTVQPPPNLIVNGEFEADPRDVTVFWSSTLEGWCRTSYTFEIHTIKMQPAYDDGFQYADLDQETNLDVYQYVRTVPGLEYTLSLWHSGQHRSTINPTDPIDSINTDVLINDEIIDTITRTETDYIDWRQFSYLFNGNGTTKIMIRGAGTQDKRGANIDGIRVELSQTQPMYQVTYYFTPNITSCSLCQFPQRSGEDCVSSVGQQTDCYAYFRNDRLVPVHCWRNTPRMIDCAGAFL